MLVDNFAIFEAAGRHLGVKEWPGAKDNPIIEKYFKDVGHGWVQDDETPWCAAFVGSVLAELGLQHTGALNARSYEDWGREVSQSEVQPGDIVVLWRKDPDGWQGHVGFFVRFEGDQVWMRGGNQGNQVSDAPYPLYRVLSYRSVEGVPDPITNRPTLRHGDEGAFVGDLQVLLQDRGFHVGKNDRKFDDELDAVVRKYQALAGDLKIDGVVGRKTWTSLMEGEVRQKKRNHTEETLRDAGSETIVIADWIEKWSKRLGLSGTGLTGTDLVTSGMQTLQAHGSDLDAIQQFLADKWLHVLVFGVVVALAVYGPKVAKRLRNNRVKDANTAANMRL